MASFVLPFEGPVVDLLEKLRELRSKHPEIGDVDGLGLALRMEMCHPDSIAPWRELADRMFQIGLEGNLQIGGKTMGLILDIGERGNREVFRRQRQHALGCWTWAVNRAEPVNIQQIGRAHV